MANFNGIHGLLTPDLVRMYAAQGMTLKEIGSVYGCTGSNIAHAIDKRDDLKEAWEQGHAELLIAYTGQLKKRAFENDTLLMFALKTQCGYVEQQYVIGKEKKQEAQPQVHVYLPAKDDEITQGKDHESR